MLPVGITHGDWVPWNLAVAGGALHAWDWEHVRLPDVVYLDLVHWHVQREHIKYGRSLPEAFLRSRPHVMAQLRSVGAGKEQCSAVLKLAVLQVADRSLSLAEGTGLWRPDVREGVLSLLSSST